MEKSRIKNVVIVGGGTAGWITAALMGKFLGQVTNIRLIESDAIGRIGVGEATIPQIVRLKNLLGYNEADMMRACGATFKLGIQFENWGHIGESYLHGFGFSGSHLNALQFHHYWLKSREDGIESNFWDFSVNEQACKENKFAHFPSEKNGLSDLIYAYHFDAYLFSQFLRRFAEKLGVERTEGKVVDVNLDAESGDIASVKMESGDVYEGDLFIDCTGFRSLLLGKALGVEYQDWSHWLPCNRAVAISSARVEPLPPYTRARAHSAGWQWRIPLQHRNGDGHVYSSNFMGADEAERILIENLEGEAISAPNHIKFTTGRREKFWHKNCVAIGLSNGFLEPLESTSIHLIRLHAGKLIEQFPAWPIQDAARDEYNRQCSEEFDLIRDFLILHYNRTDRDDSEFWRYCKNMDIPDSLHEKMELFRQTAKLRHDPKDLFAEASWVQVMIGQGLWPESFHTRAHAMSKEQLTRFFSQIKGIIGQQVATMPSQADYIKQYCHTDLT